MQMAMVIGLLGRWVVAGKRVSATCCLFCVAFCGIFCKGDGFLQTVHTTPMFILLSNHSRHRVSDTLVETSWSPQSRGVAKAVKPAATK